MLRFLTSAIFLLIFAVIPAFADTVNSDRNPTRLILPPALYAVPGEEINIYFDNIVLVQNINDYSFRVSCGFGRQDQERWRFTPQQSDVGKFPLEIKVYDKSGIQVGGASTTIFVSPADSGKGLDITILVIGDSLTAANIYPRELYNLFKKLGNPDVRFIGSHTGGGRPPRDGYPLVEGYGGWRWSSYCSRWIETPPTSYSSISSPFLVKKDDKPVLDFQAYCNKKNNGKAPDYITIFLGINDVFKTENTNADLKRAVDEMFENAQMLISEFRKVGPHTKIAIAVIPPPAASQDAFGENYKCGQPCTRSEYRKKQHYAVERIIAEFAGREKENLFLIPVFVNIDCVNNYPVKEEQINARNPKKVFRQSNALHPAPEGYCQIADSFYAWFKYEFTRQENMGCR